MDNIFSTNEISWLSKHKKVYESINILLEDSKNVNSLHDGTPDLEPFLEAQLAAQITIEVAKKNLIGGPYDLEHFLLIAKYKQELSTFNKDQQKSFWHLFSFHSGCSFDEDESKIPEQIYMEAIIATFGELDIIDLIDNNATQVYDLNTNTKKDIAAKGLQN
jgi:hypothetical protein